MSIIYDVLLKEHNHFGVQNYICIFYDDDRKKALKEMQKYVKSHGFSTPDKKYSIADVVLRERDATGAEISITPYHKLFNVITNELLK